MTKKISLIALVLALFACGCDEDPMCSKNEDCLNFCRAYDGNKLMYTCSQNACVCISKEALSCTGEADETVCSDLCAKYAPGKNPACVDKFCECQDNATDSK